MFKNDISEPPVVDKDKTILKKQSGGLGSYAYDYYGDYDVGGGVGVQDPLGGAKEIIPGGLMNAIVRYVSGGLMGRADEYEYDYYEDPK